jgi:ATP-dependent DNA helicase MPH1
VLLAERREEKNWNKAREAYNQVQRSIVRGDQLELYTDVERLIPDNIKPECLEMVMEIQEYDPSTTKTSCETAGKGPNKKRKRNADPARDIAPGARSDENAGSDDDKATEACLFAPRQATSMSAALSKPPKAKRRRS